MSAHYTCGTFAPCNDIRVFAYTFVVLRPGGIGVIQTASHTHTHTQITCCKTHGNLYEHMLIVLLMVKQKPIDCDAHLDGKQLELV